MGSIIEQYLFNNKLFVRKGEQYTVYFEVSPEEFLLDTDGFYTQLKTGLKEKNAEYLTRGEFYDTLKRDIKEHCNFEKMQRIINND